MFRILARSGLLRKSAAQLVLDRDSVEAPGRQPAAGANIGSTPLHERPHAFAFRLEPGESLLDELCGDALLFEVVPDRRVPIAALGQAFSPALQDRYSGNATCVVTGGVPAIVPSSSIILQGWSPAARANQPFTEASLGVRIDYTYTFQFPIVPGYASVSTFDYAVMPIDPVGIPSPIPTTHGGP